VVPPRRLVLLKERKTEEEEETTTIKTPLPVKKTAAVTVILHNYQIDLYLEKKEKRDKNHPEKKTKQQVEKKINLILNQLWNFQSSLSACRRPLKYHSFAVLKQDPLCFLIITN